MLGSTWRPRIATVNSSPSISVSISRSPGYFAASLTASSRSFSANTRVTPTLEPSQAGLTISGKPTWRAAACTSAPRGRATNFGVGRPIDCHTRLERVLSIDSAEPSTPEPVYGTLSDSSAPCSTPSSPPPCWPCRMLNTRAKWPARSASSSAGMPSIACASIPRASSAASTLRPESSDTSRSAELPPITTATRPNWAGSLILFTLILLTVIPMLTCLSSDGRPGPAPPLPRRCRRRQATATDHRRATTPARCP